MTVFSLNCPILEDKSTYDEFSYAKHILGLGARNLRSILGSVQNIFGILRKSLEMIGPLLKMLTKILCL